MMNSLTVRGGRLCVVLCVQKRAIGLGVHDNKTQEKLRIVSGTAAGTAHLHHSYC